MNKSSAEVAIIMGSQSDWPTMRHAAQMLDQLGVAYDIAHRVGPSHARQDDMPSPRARRQPGSRSSLPARAGPRIFPEWSPSMTTLPVLGVPVESKALRGQDSLLSIVQMPAGIAVGTLAIGEAGAANAGLLAAQVLALSDSALAAAHRGMARRAHGRRRRNTGRRRLTVPLKPGDTIGILGGGQLGRMLAMAAARLGFRTQVSRSRSGSASRTGRQQARRGKLPR